jgi:hypothetical protein
VRANDVRKRLSSYYASADAASSIQINLPLGTYVPNFIPHEPTSEKTHIAPLVASARDAALLEATSLVPAFSTMALMRPALLALLLCIFLMRHRLEDREPYLRFWDHILSGRNVLLLSIAPEEVAKLAPSLYPIAWIAGRYGVDTAIENGDRSENQQDRLASVQESIETPPSIAKDKRLRWILTGQTGDNIVTDHASSKITVADISSAALLTILPEDTATLHVQGTDSVAVEHLLENLTSQKNFPDGVIDELGSHHPLQVLLLHTLSGQWQTQIFIGAAS